MKLNIRKIEANLTMYTELGASIYYKKSLKVIDKTVRLLLKPRQIATLIVS